MGTNAPQPSTSRVHVLLVDDEASFREATARRLELRGFTVSQAASGAAADAFLRQHSAEVIVCDLKMPGIDGVELLRRHIDEAAGSAWIMITGQASVETAVASLKLGAVEYLQKPIDIEALEACIRRAYQAAAPARALSDARRQIRSGDIQFGIYGRSRHVRDTYDFIHKAARSDQPVLITGESGTGKELVARGIHEQSDRSSRPFVAINCASLSDTLLANELFGHVEGAYTGAVGNKLGLFDVADGGSLFIDEIGDMSLQNQAAVLRVIETGQFRRLGDTRERVVDVRIIAATLRNLPEMVARQAFRDDLYYRLNVLPFQLWPLSQRREDVPLLIQHFLESHIRRTGQPKRLTPEALVVLQSYDWPGNVREMANVIERAATLCDAGTITPADLRLGIGLGVPTPQGMSQRLEDVEREHILRVLQVHDGNKVASAKALGISRMRLYRKLEQYGVPA